MPWFLNPESNAPGDSGDGKSKDAFIILGLDGLNDPATLDKVIETAPRVQWGSTKRCYHAQTRGCLVDGILRRVDPANRGMVQFIEEEIKAKVGADAANYVPTIPEAKQGDYNIAQIGTSNKISI